MTASRQGWPVSKSVDAHSKAVLVPGAIQWQGEQAVAGKRIWWATGDAQKGRDGRIRVAFRYLRIVIRV